MSESKQKKITVNFFLNKNVQPDSIVDGKTGKSRKAYPLYLSVTFNRKNMQFKSNYGMIYSDLNDVPEKLMEFEENLITKIIRIESSMGDEAEYEMKGLSKRYEVFANSLSTALEKYLKRKLRLAILSTNDELFKALDLSNTSGNNPVLILYKAATRLFDNFENKINQELKQEIETYGVISSTFRSEKYDFPTIIDWFDPAYRNEFQATLAKTKPDVVQNAVSLIDGAVKRLLKELQ